MTFNYLFHISANVLRKLTEQHEECRIKRGTTFLKRHKIVAVTILWDSFYLKSFGKGPRVKYFREIQNIITACT